MGRAVSMNPRTFGDYPISGAEREAEAAMYRANLAAAAKAARRHSSRLAAPLARRHHASTAASKGGGDSGSGDEDGDGDPDSDHADPSDPASVDPTLESICREAVELLLARIDADIAAGVPRWSQRMGASS